MKSITITLSSDLPLGLPTRLELIEYILKANLDSSTESLLFLSGHPDIPEVVRQGVFKAFVGRIKGQIWEYRSALFAGGGYMLNVDRVEELLAWLEDPDSYDLPPRQQLLSKLGRELKRIGRRDREGESYENHFASSLSSTWVKETSKRIRRAMKVTPQPV